ncbi:MAG: hypothetical protein IT535_14840 [Bauldia sp.]|nr:hypothetical protein [Bauldia sp.]
MPFFIVRGFTTEDAITWMVYGQSFECEERALEAARNLEEDAEAVERSMIIIKAHDVDEALWEARRRRP